MLSKSLVSEEMIETGARVDPRVLRTRQMLEDTFLKLLWEVGFEAMTVRDIARLAGVNRTTFYAHFEDKYALFRRVLDQGFDALVQERLPRDATFSQRNLHLLTMALIEFFRHGSNSDCDSARNQPIRPMIESRVQEKLASLLHTWLIDTPNLRLRAALERTATLISWTLFGFSFSAAKQGSPKVSDAEVEEVVKLILHGAVQDENDTVTNGNNSHLTAHRDRNTHHQRATVR